MSRIRRAGADTTTTTTTTAEHNNTAVTKRRHNNAVPYKQAPRRKTQCGDRMRHFPYRRRFPYMAGADAEEAARSFKERHTWRELRRTLRYWSAWAFAIGTCVVCFIVVLVFASQAQSSNILLRSSLEVV